MSPTCICKASFGNRKEKIIIDILRFSPSCEDLFYRFELILELGKQKLLLIF